MSLENSSIKRFIGKVISYLFKPLDTRDSVEWAADNVTIGLDVTTVKAGKFNALVFPAIEYLYNCLDNPFIPIIYCMKSARFGWSTATMIWLTRIICEWPRTALFCFGTKADAHKFYKLQWQPFVQGIPIYLKSINIGIPLSKISWANTNYYGGLLSFISTRIITNVKSTNAPIALVEEPDNHSTETQGEGDLISLLLERAKAVPLVLRKIVVGGTGTIEGASRIAELMTYSNWMVFKAECHNCKSLIPMDYTFFNHFRWEVWEDGKEHKQFGKYNPKSVKWHCPECDIVWTFEQKNRNVINGKKYGFTDHTGVFSKGWHPQQPEITDIFGFIGSECLSPLEGSNFEEMSKKLLAAEYALLHGNEGLMISVANNMKGIPYRTSKLPISVEVLKNHYSTFEVGRLPYDAFIPYLGIDVQRDRLAFVIGAYGMDKNLYIIDWWEKHGQVTIHDSELWQYASDIVRKGLSYVSGITLFYNGIIIDCQDGTTAQYVYAWAAGLIAEGYPVFCVRGVNSLNLSSNPIFELPSTLNFNVPVKEKTLADSYGIVPYKMGTHACQTEVMRYLENNTVKGLDGQPLKQEILKFTRYEREDFLEQMTSCMLVPQKYQGKVMYKWELRSGKRMEALACVKEIHWAAAKDGILLMSNEELAALRHSLMN